MNAFTLLFLICGLNISFLYWGVLQERITTNAFEISLNGTTFPYQFKNIFFLNATQSAVCGIAALVVLSVSWLLSCVTRRRGTPSKKNAVSDAKCPSVATLFGLGLSYAMGPSIGLLSLHFISYPLFLLIKTAKLIPNMTIGFFYYGHRYEKKRVFAALVITVGLVLFTASDNQKRGYSADFSHVSADALASAAQHVFVSLKADPVATVTRALRACNETLIQDEANFRVLAGALLVVANMFIDAFTASTQDELVMRYGFSPLQLMLLTNVFAFFVLAVICVASEAAHASPDFSLQTLLAAAVSSYSAVSAALATLLYRAQGQTVGGVFLVLRDFAVERVQLLGRALEAYAHPARVLPIMQNAAVQHMWVPPQVFASLVLFLRSAEFQRNVGWYMLCGVSGQLFLFTLQNTAGSLFVVSVTMIRKMLSILVALVTAHYQSDAQGALVDPAKLGAVALILFGIGIEFAATLQKKRARKA